MATKPKTFDCVEMKHQAQKEILAEWEARKHEFSSYGEFLESSIQESDWGRRMRAKVHQNKSRA